VLVLAQEEAQRLNHNYIGTEHLLLGLVREGEGIAAKVLGNLGVELSKARSAVEFIIGRGDRMVIGDISLTPRAKKVIELAVEDARRLRHNYVGTEHLLLGLIREGEGVAIGVLQSLGVLPEQLRTNLVATILAAGHAGPESGSEASGPRDNVVSCRINDRDLEKIDMLIEAGIRSTRSDAASWLIHAGIAANRQLFERVQATVGEIRRLREEAQAMARGLLANEGTAAPPPERPDQGPEAPPAGSA
jgi:ATP-dependent Clp protease ATP-binding subunit ClpA